MDLRISSSSKLAHKHRTSLDSHLPSRVEVDLQAQQVPRVVLKADLNQGLRLEIKLLLRMDLRVVMVAPRTVLSSSKQVVQVNSNSQIILSKAKHQTSTRDSKTSKGSKDLKTLSNL